MKKIILTLFLLAFVVFPSFAFAGNGTVPYASTSGQMLISGNNCVGGFCSYVASSTLLSNFLTYNYASSSFASLFGVNNFVGTSTFRTFVTLGGDGTRKGALEFMPANGAYNWFTIMNDEAGGNEGLVIKSGAYPAYAKVLLQLFPTGNMFVNGQISMASGTVSTQGLLYTAYTPGGSGSVMATSTSYYFGTQVNYYMTTSVGINYIYFQKAGVVKNVQVSFRNGATASVGGGNLTLYLRKNNTTDYTVSTHSLTPGNGINQSRYTVSIPVSAGDYFEIKMTTPSTWTTLPSYPGVYVSAYVE
jgi:hypothetical protein